MTPDQARAELARLTAMDTNGPVRRMLQDRALGRQYTRDDLRQHDRYSGLIGACLGEACDECGQLIPANQPHMINVSHLVSCSLHPDNVS